MNDVIKSIMAVTLLAMLGGFSVAVTHRIVPASYREATSGFPQSPVPPFRRDSSTVNNGPRDSASVKVAQ